jgi:hypothetical protein
VKGRLPSRLALKEALAGSRKRRFSSLMTLSRAVLVLGSWLCALRFAMYTFVDITVTCSAAPEGL